MASAEECREALQTLTGRLAEMNPQDRASYFGKRSMRVCSASRHSSAEAMCASL